MDTRNCCKCFTVSLVPAAALILVLVFGVGIVLLPVLFTELSIDYKYGVVIDAGSSHTTLYMYKWAVPTDEKTNSKTGEVKEIFNCQGSSLNSYTNNPNNSAQAFSHCLQNSYDEKYIPSELKNTTTMYLGATAGMRLLNASNPTASKEVLDAVKTALKKSKYHFKHANIISGKKEAAAGWTTANYLNGFFYPEKTQGPTVGSLDMGGASAEIAFKPPTKLADKSYIVTETLFNKGYDVYARSYLCYGVNEAYSRFLAQLVAKNENKTTNVSNPCLYPNATVSTSPKHIYTACVNSSLANSVFGHQIHPPTTLESKVTFNGTWNMSECERIIGETFNFTNCTSGDSCQYTSPPVSGKFVGFSGFYHTASFFKTSSMSFTNTTLWTNYSQRIQSECSQNETMARKKHQNQGHFNKECFFGVYNVHVLQYGYGFNNATPGWSVKFEEKVNKISVGWTMGYLLNLTNTIPQSPYDHTHPYSSVDLVVGMVVLTILCAIFVIFFFLTFYACRKSLKLRGGYQNIP